MDFVTLFNKKLVEFVNDLATAFPHFGDFQTMKTILNIAVNATPSTPYKIFHSTAVKYEQQIMAKDEKFLLEENYESEHIDIDIADKIKAIWKETDDHNKEIIWTYLKHLVILDKKIHTQKGI